MKKCRIFLLLTSCLLLFGIACKQPTVTNSPSTYSIYFDPNGGTGTMSPISEPPTPRLAFQNVHLPMEILFFMAGPQLPIVGKLPQMKPQ